MARASRRPHLATSRQVPAIPGCLAEPAPDPKKGASSAPKNPEVCNLLCAGRIPSSSQKAQSRGTRVSVAVEFACAMLLLSSGAPSCAHAAPTAEGATLLAADLTPVGAERAGNGDGNIPPWEGGLPQSPGIDPGVGYLDPFADDPVLFTITVANADRYKDKLSPGHLALLKRYPDTFRMPVYRTRRSAAIPVAVEQEIRRQAGLAVEDGYRIRNVGLTTVPFPRPTDGLQVIWNHIFRWRGGSVSRQYTWLLVTAHGLHYKALIRDHEVFAQHGYMTEAQPGRLYNEYAFYLAPPELANTIFLRWEPIDPVGDSTINWRFDPFSLRVQRLPFFGYDDIPPATGGLRVSDQYDGFNGAPDDYDWKLLGKRERFIAYNAYRLGSKKARYAEILKPHHVNPEFLRYELHRVWVVEATLRRGAHHRYPRRLFYVDEDTWQIVQEEVYEESGELWRFGDHQTIQFYDVMVPWYRALVHYDLRAGAYLVSYLDNEEKFAWRWGWRGRPVQFVPDHMQTIAKW